MEIGNTMAEMYAMRTKLRTKRDLAKATLEAAQTDLNDAEAKLSIWEQAIGIYETDPPVISDDTPFYTTASDIQNCETQPEALRTYAKLNEGLVHVTKVGDLIIEAGLSKGKRSSVHSTLHNYMTKRTHEWTWVEPGVFRWNLLNGRHNTPEQHDGDSDGHQSLRLALTG